jgi:hypothetical protein
MRLPERGYAWSRTRSRGTWRGRRRARARGGIGRERRAVERTKKDAARRRREKGPTLQAQAYAMLSPVYV